MKRFLSLAIAFIAGPAAAQTGSPRAVETKPALGAWCVDLSNLDSSVKPGDDFYRYVNGRWLAQDRIPPDRPAWGSFNELQRSSEQLVQQMWFEVRDALRNQENAARQGAVKNFGSSTVNW